MPGSRADQVDLIILATTTPDHTFPATATKVQAELGITHGVAFDLQAVCSGFIFALSVADNFIRLGQAKTALVIGAETFSRILDWEDRTTCVLFGDGAGAVVLQAEEGEGTSADHGILSTHLHSDGRHYELLWVDGGPSATQSTGHVRMVGQDVFRHAVTRLSEVVVEALEANNLKACRYRLAGAASGEQADHRRHGAEAEAFDRQGGHDRGPSWQHVGRFDPAGACRSGP